MVETVLIKYQSQRYFSFLYLPDFSEVLHPQNSFSPQLSSFNSNIPFSFCPLFLAYLTYYNGFKCKLYVDNSLISISNTDLFSNLFPHIFGCFSGMSHPTSSHLITFSPSQPVPPLPLLVKKPPSTQLYSWALAHARNLFLIAGTSHLTSRSMTSTSKIDLKSISFFQSSSHTITTLLQLFVKQFNASFPHQIIRKFFHILLFLQSAAEYLSFIGTQQIYLKQVK